MIGLPVEFGGGARPPASSAPGPCWHTGALLSVGRQPAQFGHALARIEAGTIGRTVQIDDIARMRGDQNGCAQRLGEVVELRHMPVGVVDLRPSA